MVQFKGFEITVSVTIEAFVLVSLAKKDKNEVLYWASIAVLALSIFTFLGASTSFYVAPKEFYLLANMRLAALIAMMLSVFGSGILIRTLDFKFSEIVKPTLTYTWILILFTLITVETSDLFDYLWYDSTSFIKIFYRDNFIWFLQLGWIIMALALFFYSFKKKVNTHLYSSLIIAAITVIFSGIVGFYRFSPLTMFLPVLNIRSLSLLVSCIGLWFMLNTLKKEKSGFANVCGKIIGISIVFLFFIFLTTDTRDIFEKRVSLFGGSNFFEFIRSAGYLMQLSLSGIWLLYSIALMITGIYKRNFDIRIVSIILFGITILKIFFYDLSNLDTLYRIFSFIGLGLTLLLVSYLYYKYKHLILPEKPVVQKQE